jgi:hypothetical protein
MEQQAITTTEQQTEAAAPVNPGDVMYAKKEATPVAPKEETKASTDSIQDKSVEASAQKQSENKEEVKLDLKAPQGSHLTQAAVDEIVSFAKEQGLSQEAAQKLLDREHNAVEGYKQTQLQQFEQMRDEWWNAVQSDKELGGDNFKQTAEHARRAMDKFAPEGLKTFLKDSPYSNHPDLVRLFANIGKAMDGDKLVLAGTQSSQILNPIDIMYDNSKEK